MDDLLRMISLNYQLLTEKPKPPMVYICFNDDWLLAVGKTSDNRADALSGEITTQKHTKAGICMMAKAIKQQNNSFRYIACQSDQEARTLENAVQNIVRNHFGLNGQQGGTYIDGIAPNQEASRYLKNLLLERYRENNLDFFDRAIYSFNDILELVNKDGDAWSNLLSSEVTAEMSQDFLTKIDEIEED